MWKEKKIAQNPYMNKLNFKYFPLITTMALLSSKNVQLFNLLLDGPNNLKL